MAKIKYRTRYIGRRKGGHRKKSFTLPVAVVAGFLPGAWRLWNHRQDMSNLTNEAGRIYLGYDSWTGSWDWKAMKFGTFPIVAGIAVHKLVGGKLGVNAMLARAGVPIIRL